MDAAGNRFETGSGELRLDLRVRPLERAAVHRRSAPAPDAVANTIVGMATTEDRDSLDATRAWREELYDRTPERKGELFSTISGLENAPRVTPEAVSVDYDRDLGYPGVCPFPPGLLPPVDRR